MLRLIDRFGVQAVLNRPQLYYRELVRMYAAENVYNAKRNRDHSDDWVKWSENNPHAAALLAKAEKIING